MTDNSDQQGDQAVSDAVERVARRICQFSHSPKYVRDNAMTHARLMVAEYNVWLTEQGIPIDKLLSGEMVAVPSRPSDEMIDASQNISFQTIDHGHIRLMQTARESMVRWQTMVKQAQLDCAGGQVAEQKKS